MEDLKFVGSEIIKIDAQKNPEFNGKIKIKTSIKINSIEKTQKNKDMLKLSYTFEVKYDELGKIFIEGNLFLLGNSKNIQKILTIQKNKEYNSPEYIMITNLIIQKASIKAFELEEELKLPIHIKFPTLSVN